MSFLNGPLLKQLANIRATNGDAELAIGEPPLKRVLFIRRGELLGGVSDYPDERVGALIAAEGKVDPALIDAIAKAAAAQGRMLGDALIGEGLLTPTDLAAVLERQSVLRFERALTMDGRVRSLKLGTVRGVIRKPVGALLVAFFRDRLSPEVVETLAMFLPRSAFKLQGQDQEFSTLGLSPAELRVQRRLAQGESLLQMTEGPQGDQALRLVLALTSLGLVVPSS